VVAVVIEAIHPPAGAAAAYHRVQAAEIEANTTIATERGRARAARALAEQRSRTRLDEARATAAEQRGEAAIADIRFAADRAADQAGGPAFLLERAQDSLVAALAGTPKTILDRRLGAGGPTVVDLRPFLPAAPAARDD
jgi:regulator of protease activity HflC (stomatin/prohibitin superfamily)